MFMQDRQLTCDKRGRVSPENVINAAVTEAVSTFSLPGLTQDQPAGLAAVFGFRSFYEVIPEPSTHRQEARRSA